ncbi:MAG: peptidase M50 [Candidatus Peregrinibacteria bacterium GW2011_GWF2_33_10]|nr:MAG: peptidase M50 [Candidatus Peregrinibacteria bacterium GW2011_GWF2_33_10]OGJ44106.1 MAG: hypothetical protein A2272_00365 [Candidatus Peregrinibacteria bacterium RIFOXYA12_FULL_33_12]OGJ44385.1 MAG: hypothetical protein A2263_05855 [Candidatus Peregrinibacteria bacterium RIFOXYA2_FULL_33_21]OGJ50180.1 MAG: hypothetical protein A2307_03345 [Candidatus Peregrinibacteria bacterium RIFOXYB2_FULL_33_20]
MSFLAFLIALIVGVTIHEFSHAFVANLLGDKTPKIDGRLSLNPIRHMDLLGTLALFIFHIGWGKPVIINDRNFKKPIRDSALTAIAGPISNLATAFLIALPLKYLSFGANFDWLLEILNSIFTLSIVLAVFNLIPLPPFDGSKILALFIPSRYQYQYQEFMQKGVVYVLLLLLFDAYVLKAIFHGSLISRFISLVYDFIATFIYTNT